MNNNRGILVFILSALMWAGGFGFQAKAQPVNYPEVFGNNWIKARQFVTDNESRMKQLCARFRVDYPLAISMVFPELVRYSAVRDKMEITLLKALYTYKGTEYSDFSVGIFQVKPSCAEAILEDISGSGDRKLKHLFDELHHSLSGNELRAAILRELEDPDREFIYVLGMIKILDRKYASVKWNDQDEKIRFYATAYNGGFRSSENTVRRKMKEESFYTGLSKPRHCYSYAAISLVFFHELFPKTAYYRGFNS